MYFLKVNPGAPVTLSLTSSEDKSLCGISVVDKVREGFKNIKKNIKAIFHLGFLKIFCLLKCSFRLFSVIKNQLFYPFDGNSINFFFETFSRTTRFY